jgi:O-antigen/teichoic acid export membrane protein
MKNSVVFKRLAKDTSIYGLSSILARTLNFLLLPLYTRILGEDAFGIYSEIFAYIALLQVVLIFGMETGFFRFASLKDYDGDMVFSTVSCFLTLVSASFFAAAVAFSGTIASRAGYHPLAVVYAAGILSADCFTSVFFARLRYERKALRFAAFRTIKILSELGFNLLFLLVLPRYFASRPDSALLNFFTAEASYVYILAAVLCSGIVSVALFVPQIAAMRYAVSFRYLKAMLAYSFPLMLAGLQGILNDFVDRPLFRWLAPETKQTWSEQLGIYSANARLAVIMSLFVQMFRYAAEPYFFSESSNRDIKLLYAKTTKYFTVFCVAIFLLVTSCSDMLQYLLGEKFRSGIIILPTMLFAYMLSGINQNVAMWYKLASKTKTAMLVTFAGLIATLSINIAFMPLYGYEVAAWGHAASYLTMITVSWQLSKRHYKIPYQWKIITAYLIIGAVLFTANKALAVFSPATNVCISAALFGVFVLIAATELRLNNR